MAGASLAARLRHRIAADGPLPASVFIDAALYDADGGFYAGRVDAGRVEGRAGRRGDFLTAPEVGPLFGAVIGRAIDAWWTAAGRPVTFRVEEHGAGPGTLARSLLQAAPDVLAAGALRWDLIEVSPAQRALHPEHPAVRSLPAAIADPLDGLTVVFANELLDNLAFDIVVRRGDRWHRVDVDTADGRFVATDGPVVAPPPGADGLVDGTTLPVQTEAAAWCRAQLARRVHGLVVIDYAAPARELARRGSAWLRTYRDHDHAGDWTDDPGAYDITADLLLESFTTIEPPAAVRTQAAFLAAHGIDDLVEQGRRAWEAGAARGDLAALRGRSRVREAEALTDPDGMGAFTVLEWWP